MSIAQQGHDWLLFRCGANFRLGSGCTDAQEREIISALCAFINDHSLSHAPLHIDLGHDLEGFEVRYSQLTDVGQLVMKSGLSRWLAAIDRGTPPTKSKILIRTLEKVRRLAP